jgi:hypothetical protein
MSIVAANVPCRGANTFDPYLAAAGMQILLLTEVSQRLGAWASADDPAGPTRSPPFFRARWHCRLRISSVMRMLKNDCANCISQM